MTAPAKDLNQKKSAEQSPIDARLQQLSDKILPSSPYILTIPTNYRVGSHQINDWRRGSPFGAHEEQLSYLTFMPRTFDEDNIMSAIGDWDDGNGTIKEKTSNVRSGTSSPLPGQVPKKKISLADYKNKAAGQVGAKTLPQANGQIKAPEKVSMSAAPVEKISKPEETEKIQGQKRSIDAVSEAKGSDRGPVSPPAKKARITPDAPYVTPHQPGTEKTNLHELPPLLSPTLPSHIEEELGKAQLNIHHNPEKLGHGRTSSAVSTSSDKKKPAAVTSPRVSSIGKTISKEKVPVSNQTKSDILAAKKSMTGQLPKVSNSPHQTTDQKHNAPRPTSTNEGKSSKVNGVIVGKPLSIAPSKIGKEQPTSSVTPLCKSDQKRLLLVLKIPKHSRKAWGRIIKMTPRPKKPEPTKLPHIDVKEASSDRSREKSQINGVQGTDDRRQQDLHSHNNTKSTVGRKISQTEKEQRAIKTGDKRPRSKDEQDTLAPPSGKRQKPPGTSNTTPKPSTPIKPAIKSPVLSHHASAQRSQLSTPKKDLKTTAMRRIESTEGDVKTPLGGTRSSTPNAPGSTERVSRHDRSGSNASASTNIVSGKGEEIAFWRAEHKKYVDLGRTLKHDADPFLKTKSDYSIIDQDLKEGAAIAVETILCYMLGFSLGDEASRLGRKPSEVMSWESLLPYMSFVKNVTQIIPTLYGLVHQLEAVCRDTIHLYNLERLEREPSLSAALEEARIEGDFNAAELAVKINKSVLFQKKLVENARLAQQAWVQGMNNLPLQNLEQSYPTTWSKQVQTPVVPKSEEKLVPKAYGDGGYHLPLGATVSSIEAVRMGWSVLGEWSEKEGVKWVGKTGL